MINKKLFLIILIIRNIYMINVSKSFDLNGVEIENIIDKEGIVIFTSKYSLQSSIAKEELDKKGIKFYEISVDGNPDASLILTKKYRTHGIPTIFYCGEFGGGMMELRSALCTLPPTSKGISSNVEKKNMQIGATKPKQINSKMGSGIKNLHQGLNLSQYKNMTAKRSKN